MAFIEATRGGERGFGPGLKADPRKAEIAGFGQDALHKGSADATATCLAAGMHGFQFAMTVIKWLECRNAERHVVIAQCKNSGTGCEQVIRAHHMTAF